LGPSSAFCCRRFGRAVCNRTKQVIAADAAIYHVVKQIIVASLNGHPLPLVIEAARSGIEHSNQPSFAEVKGLWIVISAAFLSDTDSEEGGESAGSNGMFGGASITDPDHYPHRASRLNALITFGCQGR
jgi:hypothetical protein